MAQAGAGAGEGGRTGSGTQGYGGHTLHRQATHRVYEELGGGGGAGMAVGVGGGATRVDGMGWRAEAEAGGGGAGQGAWAATGRIAGCDLPDSGVHVRWSRPVFVWTADVGGCGPLSGFCVVCSCVCVCVVCSGGLPLTRLCVRSVACFLSIYLSIYHTYPARL